MLQSRSSKVSDSSLRVGLSRSALSLSWGLAFNLLHTARRCGLVRDKEVQHETQVDFDAGERGAGDRAGHAVRSNGGDV